MKVRKWFSVPAIAGALVAGSLEGQTPERPVGIGVHQLDGRSVADVRGLGARQVRITLYWHHTQDAKLWSEWRAGMDRAVAAGLEPLVVIHHPEPNATPASRRTLLWDRIINAAVSVARLYPSAQVQLWNEPDLPVFTDAFGAFSGVRMRERGRLYGEMLRRAYPKIKAANPRTLVVTGGLATGHDNLKEFLAGMGDAPYDVLALHTYGLPVLQVAREKAAVARAATGKPLWITEFGLEEAVIPAGWDRSRREVDRLHLEAMEQTVEWNDGAGVYARMYWHVLRQNGDKGYDLIRGDGSLRPAAQWLRARHR
ncbi:MAG: glycoside hydrolase family protein [Gemmatimonadetes bacterium]|nr:glycoside hydrolase family protein [Gemmatimonadota bacterium]